jgi:2-dehydro-3-deoxygluconokinase
MGAAEDFEVLCVGETMVMVTPEVAVPLRTAGACVLRAGGAESNVAIFLSALGHRVAWASRLGNEPLGELVLDAVGGTGVDTSKVEIADGEQTGVYFKDPGRDGTRVYYYRSTSAASRMAPGFLNRSQAQGVRAVHVSGITAALSRSCAALLDDIVIRRVLGDAVVSFDVNYRTALWSAEQAAPVLLRLAEAADVVFVGLDEAAELWGTSRAEEVRPILPTPSWVIVKDASREAYEFASPAVTRVPALRVEVVEPVGAGDAFAAGWLSGWLRGLPGRGRLRLGHLMAAVALSSTSDHGAVPGPEDLQVTLQLDDHEWDGYRPVTTDNQEPDQA